MKHAKENVKFIRENVIAEIDLEKIEAIAHDKTQLLKEITALVKKVTLQNKKYLSPHELGVISVMIADEIMGLGPLRILMEDERVSDILVNGPDDVYVEISGKLQKSTVNFLDNAHLTDIAKRLVSKMGRRIDEAQPMVDARMPDGSRLNVVISPISLDGTSISIRKFNKNSRTLQDLAGYGSMTPEMARFLGVIAHVRCNIIVSGGTGSGKTTLLNALSQHISTDERIITLEDAAELKLMQPHLVRLETRMAGVEQSGQVAMRDLVINALRMRPDRIIIGECRGGEAFEMLQAMNTGHDGSMTTIHANSPFDALSRLENLVMMAGFDLPVSVIRHNVASAVNVIVQIARLNDGSRKIINISEIGHLNERGAIDLYPIFEFRAKNFLADENAIIGEHVFHPLRENSVISENAVMFNVKKELDEIIRDVTLDPKRGEKSVKKDKNAV